MDIIIKDIISPIVNDIIDSDFLPTSFQGLNLWLDATDPFTLIEISADVSGWNDKSGNENNSLQLETDRQPKTGISFINDLNVVTFDGVDDFLDIPFSSSLNTIAFTLFVVCKVTGLGGFRSPFTSRNNAAGFGGLEGYIVYVASNNRWQGWIGIDTEWGGIITNASRDVTLDESVIFTFTAIDGNQDLKINQVNAGSGTSTPFLINSGAPTRIGAGTSELPEGGVFFMGDIGEVILYDSILTTSQILQVENYLIKKWGIVTTVSFPFAFSSDFTDDFS